MMRAMEKFIAKRELLYSLKESSTRQKFCIRISAPYLIEEGMVSFRFDPGTAACKIEFDGLPDSLTEVVYGMDSLQAVNLASNIEPLLGRLQKKYDLYWLSGEPYFED